MNLSYSADAIDDLDRLRQFIAQHNEAAANRISLHLVSKIERLADFPQLGTVIDHPDAPDSIRQLVIQKYIVRYLILTDSVVVLRVWHHREERK